MERGQIEVLSGGYYEPILPSIPNDDKHYQIRKLNGAVQHHFGATPTGMWLAERVWEPTLPTHLASAGIEWSVLDDVHFKMVGLTDEDLTGYFVTEDNGHPVNVFATSKQLRYTIPWRDVSETIEYLRGEAIAIPGKIVVMGDDGEKFGAWPDTYEHCWGKREGGVDGKGGWVEQFFTALEENSDWLHTIKLGDHIRYFPAVGRVYLPTASYNEMMEWALPARRSYEFSELTHKLEVEENPGLEYMRGGFWRNFLVKYPEINTLHKKMLRVHDIIDEARQKLSNQGGSGTGPLGDLGQEDLWRAQSNDTYWHGLFGGVYMTDIRTRVHGYLIRAQNTAELALYGSQNWIRPEITDFDRDSMHELLIEGNALNLYMDLADGGSIFQWDLRRNNYNLASTVSRREEAYHEKLRQYEEKQRAEAKRDEGRKAKTEKAKLKAQDAEPESPHTAIRVKERGLDSFLNYDLYRRASMMDHFISPGTTLDSFSKSQYTEEGDFVTNPYHAEMDVIGNNILHVVLQRDGHITRGQDTQPVRVSKRLILKPGSEDFRVLYTIENNGDTELTALFGSEWNINLLGGGHNPSAYYHVEGHELEDAALDSTGEMQNVQELAVGNSWLDIEMRLRLSREASFWRFPLEVVSGSEAGFERTYQGSCLLLQWPLTLPAGESAEIEMEWTCRG